MADELRLEARHGLKGITAEPAVLGVLAQDVPGFRRVKELGPRVEDLLKLRVHLVVEEGGEGGFRGYRPVQDGVDGEWEHPIIRSTLFESF